MKFMSWLGFGLRGRLFAAFGAVAAITVLASATAFVSYDRLGRSLEVVTGTSLPRVTRASNIAMAAADVVGQAQALLAASGADERTRALKALDEARAGEKDGTPPPRGGGGRKKKKKTRPAHVGKSRPSGPVGRGTRGDRGRA